MNLQTMRASGHDLLETITSARPHVERKIDEAANVDVIEYVKGKMVEGVQLGITSKFSAPGKYRRNMKQFRKALASMDLVEEEVKKIIQDSLFVSDNNGSDEEADDGEDLSPTIGVVRPEQDNESDIVPVSNGKVDPMDEIFNKLDSMSQDEPTKVNNNNKHDLNNGMIF